MAGDFTTVTVHNDGAYVISATLTATAEGQPWKAESGNFGHGGNHALQVPVDATDITVEVRGEAFIDVWKTVFKSNPPWPDTSGWPADGLAFETTGTAFKMHCHPTTSAAAAHAQE